MKCIRCGNVMESEAPRSVTGEVRGESVTVVLNAPACPECGHVAILGSRMRQFTRAAADSYRRKKALLTVEEMERVRRQLTLSRDEFAEYVFVGIATYKRWLRGEIQSRAYDKLVRLRTDLQCLENSSNELMERLTAGVGTANTVQTVRTQRVSGSSGDADVSCEQGGVAA
jgi:putative zinc finger/helix-turn-helix YgiT family protein